MRRLLFALPIAWALCGAAHAQPMQVVSPCGGITLTPGMGTTGTADTTGNTCVTTTPSTTTWQATMTLAAATSTSLVDANVTKAPNSAATPSGFSVLTVINSGSNAVYVCQYGGTCSATAGGGFIQAGACDTYNISPASVPTLFSTSGTTLSLRNGPGC